MWGDLPHVGKPPFATVRRMSGFIARLPFWLIADVFSSVRRSVAVAAVAAPLSTTRRRSGARHFHAVPFQCMISVLGRPWW
jgi:hypothetical protein